MPRQGVRNTSDDKIFRGQIIPIFFLDESYLAFEIPQEFRPSTGVKNFAEIPFMFLVLVSPIGGQGDTKNFHEKHWSYPVCIDNARLKEKKLSDTTVLVAEVGGKFRFISHISPFKKV